VNGTANADLAPPASESQSSSLPSSVSPSVSLARSRSLSSAVAPPGGTVSRFRYYLTSCTNEVEEDGEARTRKLKAFSCVSDPRCGRSSPASLSCSSWCRLNRAYDSSCSLQQMNGKNTSLHLNRCEPGSRSSQWREIEIGKGTRIRRSDRFSAATLSATLYARAIR